MIRDNTNFRGRVFFGGVEMVQGVVRAYPGKSGWAEILDFDRNGMIQLDGENARTMHVGGEVFLIPLDNSPRDEWRNIK